MGTINPMHVSRIIHVELKQWLTETGAYLKEDFDANYEKDDQLAQLCISIIKDEYRGNERIESLRAYCEQFTATQDTAVKLELDSDFEEELESNEIIDSFLVTANDSKINPLMKKFEMMDLFNCFMKRVKGEGSKKDEASCADYAPVHLIHEIPEIDICESFTEDSDFEPEDYEPKRKKRKSQLIFTRAEKEEIIEFAFVPGEGRGKVIRALSDIQEKFPKIRCLNDVYRLKNLLQKGGSRKSKVHDENAEEEQLITATNRTTVTFSRAEKEDIVAFAFDGDELRKEVVRSIEEIHEKFPRIESVDEVYRLRELLRKKRSSSEKRDYSRNQGYKKRSSNGHGEHGNKVHNSKYNNEELIERAKNIINETNGKITKRELSRQLELSYDVLVKMLAYKPELLDLLESKRENRHHYNAEIILPKVREIYAENADISRQQLAIKLGCTAKTLRKWLRKHSALAELCHYNPSVEQAPKRANHTAFSEEELQEIKEQIRFIADTNPSVTKVELSKKIGITCNALMRILNQNEDLLHKLNFPTEEEEAVSSKVPTMEEIDSLRERVREIVDGNPNITRSDLAHELGIPMQRLVQYFRQDEELAEIVNYKRTEHRAPRRMTEEEKDSLKQQIRDMLEVSPNLTRLEIADQLGINRASINTWLQQDEHFAELFPNFKKRQVKGVRLSKVRNKSFRTELLNTVRDRLHENPNISKKQLCEEMGINVQTLYTWIRNDQEWSELFNNQHRKQEIESEEEEDAVENIPSFSYNSFVQ